MNINDHETKNYWTNRYKEDKIGWDIGFVSTPLKMYFDQLEDKTISILIPGAGNAYEAEYLFKIGFINVYVMDISDIPLNQFKLKTPSFPDNQLLHQDFFSHKGQYDLIIEQTFFCSFPPLKETRLAYVNQMHKLLRLKGKLVGLWFDIPLTGDLEKRPFGGDKKLYLSYFEPNFKVKLLEKCYNSILPRENNEFFGIFIKQ
jgi:thiopurine S-methyltransferase